MYEDLGNNMVLCYITKEWYFCGYLTIFYLIYYIMIASFWTWKLDYCGLLLGI